MSQPAVSPPRPIQRSTSDRKLLGVCGGVAEHYGMDPLVVRIAVAVLVLFGGLGIVLYLGGAAWLPEPGDTSDLLSSRRLPLLIVAGLAALVILPNLVFPFGDGSGFLVVVALIVLLVLLVRRPVAPDVPTQPTEVLAMSAPPDAPYAEAVKYGAMPYPQVPDEPQMSGYPPPLVAPRPRSFLGAVALSTSLIWFGLAWALNAADVTSMTAVTIFGVSLAILGAGILVGAWIGRARWLVLLALPLALVVGGLAAIPDAVRLGEAADWAGQGIGETSFAPSPANQGTFALGAGSADLYVTQWNAFPADGVRRVAASVGLGELVIYVPDTWDVVVNAEVGFGSIDRDGVTVTDGSELSEQLRFDSPDAAAPQMVIDARVELGQITVFSDGTRPSTTSEESA